MSDNETSNASPESTGLLLLQLQGIDTASDQARHRKSNLEERDKLNALAKSVIEWERRCNELAGQIASAEQLVAAAEHQSQEIDAKRARLRKQMKTVIAPREAEALQHEIETLDEQRSALDEEALVKMDEQSSAESALSSLKDRESELRAQATAATSALAEVESSIDAGLLDLASTREQLIASLPSALVNRYEQVRAKLGVAAAMLTGSKCEGCHLDLSPAEVDEVRRAPADVLPDCPQCGRLLVR